MINWIQKKRNKKGFTLIELIVVIAILGILMAIAIPRFAGFRDDADEAALDANNRMIYSAIAIYEARWGEGTADTRAKLLEYMDGDTWPDPASVGPSS